MNFLSRYTSLLILAVIFAFFLIYYVSEFRANYDSLENQIADTTNNETNKEPNVDEEFLKAIIPDRDTSERVIYVSEKKYLDIPHSIDKSAGASYRRVFTGKRINIAIIGVDSRLGSRYKHADANHILSILIEQGKIEITSIPRDTPADAGFDDTTGQNKLTVMYASRGKKAYFDEIASIAGLDKIHYFIEIGFSQAMGILEWFGYEDPGSTLQILRSRTALGGDDYQRVYNQAQFIKQMILKHFDKFSSLFGKMLIRGGLLFVNTNLSVSEAESIYEQLRLANFPSSSDDILIRIRPPIPIEYKIYDFADKQVIASLVNRISSYNSKKLYSDNSESVDNLAIKILDQAIQKAKSDSSRNPNAVINNLSVYFEQRAWMQIKDKELRKLFRDEIAHLLINAYEKKKQLNNVKMIRDIIDAEKVLFNEKNVENIQ